MAANKSQKKYQNRIYMYLTFIAVVLLIIFGGLALWAHNFISDMVKNELTAQKIYFPEKGTPALDPATYPDLQQYAGQLVDTPEKARAYANGYIGRHLKEVADGKTYAEVSKEAMKDPENKNLQQQKLTLMQGEMLRGMLLSSGYGFGLAGKIAGIVAYISFTIAAVTLLMASFFYTRSKD